jgi:hypothetical protein
MSQSNSEDQKPRDPDAPNPKLIVTIRETEDWCDNVDTDGFERPDDREPRAGEDETG